MNKLNVLELFCGAGGAAMGMIQAGASVTGVDRDPHCAPFYPGRFILCDVFQIERRLMDWSYIIEQTDLVWAGPKCEGNSIATNIRADNADHTDQIAPTRAMIERWGKPYVIENVPQAATKFHRMRADVKLNGYSMKPPLMLDRPRVFEVSGFHVEQPRYIEKKDVPPEKRQKCSVFGRLISSKKKGGNPRYEYEKHWRPIEMDITHIPVNVNSSKDPETGRDYNLLALAIPPPFSKYIIEQFIAWRARR